MPNIVNARLNLWIYTGDFGSKDPLNPNYEIYKEVTGSETTIIFEIGELVRDYTEVLFTGNYSTIQQSAWVEWQMTRTYDDDTVDNTLVGSGISFNGYGYFEDGVNPQLSSDVLISNINIFHNCSSTDNIYVPLLSGSEGATKVTYLNEAGVVIRVETITTTITPITADSDKYRVDDTLILSADMTHLEVESSEITEEIEVPVDAREIQILLADGTTKTLYIKCIDCSKYEPYKVSFVNKFGVVQDIWFDKKRTDNLSVSKDSYKRNILNISATGVTYSTNTASMFPHDVIGNKSLTMNTGYVTEDYNEVIQQLMLTEYAWIHEGGDITPIVPKTNSFTKKTSVNDKLINFTVEFDYAFDTINNIR
jgi:hypothetical protein